MLPSPAATVPSATPRLCHSRLASPQPHRAHPVVAFLLRVSAVLPSVFSTRAALWRGLMLLLLALCGAGRPAGAADSDWASTFTLPGANGAVNAVVQNADAIYIGGSFTVVGTVVANRVARYDKATGAWSALGSGVDSSVYALALNGTDLYVGGNFATAGGTSINRIAKWRLSGTTDAAWSALGLGVGTASSSVNALALNGTDLYVGGNFTSAGGTSNRNRVAQWSLGGTTNAAWSALGSGVNSTVYALALSGTELYVGGLFSTAGGILNRNRIAKWSLVGTDNTAWSALGSGTNGTVRALALNGTHLYVGGSFNTAGATSVSNIAKWSLSGTTDAAWSALGSGVDNIVNALALDGTDLYVGGQFTMAGVTPASRIAKWSLGGTDNTAWSALGSGVDNIVNALALDGTDLYLGGTFTSVRYIAKWNGSSFSTVGSGNGMNGTVRAIVDGGSVVYVGGDFTAAGGVAANRVACYDKATGAWSALGSGISGSVYALTLNGTDLYVGGQFTTAGAISASNIAKWSLSGTDNTAWSALGSGVDTTVRALALNGTDLYVGGSFSTAGGTLASRIAKWRLSGTDDNAWSALGSGTSGSVYALALDGTDLYVGGQFTMAGGTSANYVARWSLSGTSDAAWSALGSGINSSVRTLALNGTDLYVGGDFATAGGTLNRNRIARWSLSGTDDNAWLALGSGTNANVLALALDATHLYVGGLFTTAGLKASSRIGRYTMPNTAPTATVSLNTSSPKTNDTLTATATASDAEGNAVRLTYVWKNGTTVVQTTSNTASLTDTLDLATATYGDKGDVITVTVTPQDALNLSGAPASDAATVADSAPVITSNGGDATGSQNVEENSTAVTTVTATDADSTDANPVDLTYSINGGADAALFTIDEESGALSFITAPDFENPTDAGANNVYEVTVQVSDDSTPDATDTQALSVTVTGINEAPSAGANEYTVTFFKGDTIVAPGVLSNDIDPEDDTVTVADGNTANTNAPDTTDPVTGPTNGTLTLKADGSFTYVPNLGFAGDDSFTYKATDGSLESNVATVTIHVSANTAPTAVDDSKTTTEDTFIDIDVLANDLDLESSNTSLSVAADSIASVTGGTAVLQNDSRTIRFTPDANANDSSGTFSFTYKVSDGTDSSALAATATINVTAVNDVPSFIKGSDQSATNSLGAKTVTGWATNLSAGPTDEAEQTLDFIVSLSDGDSALFSVQPAISSDGTLTYTPQAGQFGIATVSVRIHDDGGTDNGGVDTSAVQTFTINVKEDVRPDVTITSPSNNARLHLSELSSGSIRGTATDNIGVTGVKVMVRRYRGNAFSYWNGTTFTTTNSLVNATLSSNGTEVTWSLDTAIPASELDAGVYFLSALANDEAGNSRYSATHTLTLYGDGTAPGVAISAPTQNQRLQTNELVSGSIRGTATDNVGVTQVKIVLRRFRGSSLSYWNGSTFTSTHTPVNTTLSGTGTDITWSLNSAIPAAQLDTGTYHLTAVASDAAGNTTHSTTRNFTLFNADTTPPGVTISAPTQKQRLHVSELVAGSIRGTATDGVGVTRVWIVLRRFRSSGAAYWNGSSFVSSHTPVNATLSSNGTDITWSLNSAIPAEQLDVGNYFLTAVAIDAAGNSTHSATREFIVHNDGTTSPNSTSGSSAGGS